ncbi:hypothetical protein J31TS4_31110 [Paenibacillus sp. J31TS4]|uniref:hypothetical protein n=1 Tax=Paenibacillus sp. J31TS4 TaxID=2807195 RepID=UPI001B1EDCF8|nr:hypothetical protein [Paenibacillus sp. J31TS4]GIP39831.1 hypothetical protein J31TS4_31110 [Paenibacillus sp. J31TS4]
MMTRQARKYNGMVLLYGYLQRLFVSERIQEMLEYEPSEEARQSLTASLDTLTPLLRDFDPARPLTLEAETRLLAILDELEPALDRYEEMITPGARFEPMLIVAASTLYAEEHINQGLVHWGKHFDPTAEDRYRQQVPRLRSRVGSVTEIVKKVSEGIPLSADDHAEIDRWYGDVLRNRDGIRSDAEKIRELLKAE